MTNKGKETNNLNTNNSVSKSITLVLCFVYIFALVFMYMLYKDNMEKVYSDNLVNELERFEKVMDTFYIESKNIGISAYMDVDIRNVLQDANPTKEDKINAVKRLKQYKNFNIYAESVCFYDANKQLIYSSEYNLPWNADDFSADPGLIELINMKKKSVLRQKNGKQGNIYTVLVYPFNGKDDAVVINYYSNVFNSFFRDDTKMFVIDNDRKCYAGNVFAQGEDLSGEKYIEDIFSDNREKSIFKAKICSNKSIAAYKKTSDFVYVNSEYTSVLAMKIIYKMIPWILILTSFLLILSYVLVNYGKKIREFFHNTNMNMDKMKLKVQSKENDINKERMYDFLNGLLYMTDEQLREAASNIAFNMDQNKEANMIFIRIEHFKSIVKEMPLKYRKSICFSIINVMDELLENIAKCDMIALSDSEIIILYNTDNCYENKIKDIISQMQKLFKDKMDIIISAFIGNGAENVFGLAETYKALLKLKEYSFYEGLGCILTLDYMNGKPDEEFDYTIENRIQFEKVLKTGSYEKMSAMFDNMIKPLEKSNPTYVKCELIQFVLQMQQIILKMTDYTTKITDKYSNIFNDIMNAQTIGEIIGIFRDVFQYLSENVINVKDQKHESMVTRVEKIVEEFYGDINFSRTSISDALNINANYADSLFKKHTGKTISAFITEYRLEKSKELLNTTNYSINKIAGMVGYSGGSHFIYSFKKKFGMTPNEYRELS